MGQTIVATCSPATIAVDSQTYIRGSITNGRRVSLVNIPSLSLINTITHKKCSVDLHYRSKHYINNVLQPTSSQMSINAFILNAHNDDVQLNESVLCLF